MNEKIPWRIDRRRCALLVIDMQNDFVEPGGVLEVPMARKFVPNIKRILDCCRNIDVPVIFTQHTLTEGYHISPLEAAYNPVLFEQGMREGSHGVAIYDDLAPINGETVIKKHRYDSFHNTQLESILRSRKGYGVIDTVIITGTVTNICCDSTARGAYMRDFKVVMVSDSCGGLDEQSQRATLEIIGSVFGRVMDTEGIINALMEGEEHLIPYI
ncbi:MAG TPA: cysteine hydrolase [Firmicutes bacterium]|nr:cysteine hydrolase [Bacillota bacterium]